MNKCPSYFVSDTIHKPSYLLKYNMKPYIRDNAEPKPTAPQKDGDLKTSQVACNHPNLFSDKQSSLKMRKIMRLCS